MAFFNPVSRRRLIRRLFASMAAASAFLPAAAQARDVIPSFGPNLSFVFGEELGIGWGIEMGVNILEGDGPCSRCDGRTLWGPQFQLTFINIDQLRLVTAFQLGHEIGEQMGLVGEVGVAFHTFPERQGIGLHTGAYFQTPSFPFLFARQEWFLDDYSVGGGVHILSPFSDPDAGVIDGRPWRDEHGNAQRSDGAWDDAPPDECSPAALWATHAQSECAAIPAFWQLAIELLAHGAPDDLVDAAIDAANDEVRHTIASARIASSFAGRRFRPQLANAQLRAPLGGDEGLERLAIESWRDGCLNEGAAARIASRAAGHGEATRAPLMTIAEEERRHADLGWQILAWSLERGGAALAERLAAERDPVVVVEAADVLSARQAHRHGLLDAGERSDLFADEATQASQRLDRCLHRTAHGAQLGRA
jgi:hypothetical protein